MVGTFKHMKISRTDDLISFRKNLKTDKIYIGRASNGSAFFIGSPVRAHILGGDLPAGRQVF